MGVHLRGFFYYYTATSTTITAVTVTIIMQWSPTEVTFYPAHALAVALAAYTKR